MCLVSAVVEMTSKGLNLDMRSTEMFQNKMCHDSIYIYIGIRMYCDLICWQVNTFCEINSRRMIPFVCVTNVVLTLWLTLSKCFITDLQLLRTLHFLIGFIQGRLHEHRRRVCTTVVSREKDPSAQRESNLCQYCARIVDPTVYQLSCLAPNSFFRTGAHEQNSLSKQSSCRCVFCRDSKTQTVGGVVE